MRSALARLDDHPAQLITHERPSAKVPAALPFYLPGIGAYPGSLSEDGSRWHYEAPAPTGGRVKGQRAVVGLVRVSSDQAAWIAEALTAEPTTLGGGSTNRRYKELQRLVSDGSPEEVAQAIAEMRGMTSCFSLRRLKDQAVRIIRSVLAALPDSVDRRRAYAVLETHCDKKKTDTQGRKPA